MNWKMTKKIQNVAWSIKNIADSVFDLVVEAKRMPNLVPGSKINFLSFLEGFIKTYEQNRAPTFTQLTIGSINLAPQALQLWSS